MINKGIKIQNKEDIKIYFFGGKGKFILKSNKTGKWFMYKMTKPKDNDEIYYISVLLDGYYQYLGVIKIDDIDYIRTKKVKIDNNHESIKGIKWLLKQFKNDKKFPNDMEFYHMGICCCCGRTLTVKDNIELGIGPICFKNYGKKNKRIMRIVKIRELKKNIKNK
ncbi:MAG: DUF6011 domain-containing protein [Saccharofermentanales bacterium]